MRVASFLRITALAAGALVATAPLASQDTQPRRLKVSDTGLPGIDLGLAPRARLDAIGGRTRLRDAEAAPGPWIAGRVLVKFRDRDHAEHTDPDPRHPRIITGSRARVRSTDARGEGTPRPAPTATGGPWTVRINLSRHFCEIAGMGNGAQERTRTFTAVKPLAPEASASTNSATWARVAIRRIVAKGADIGHRP